jgi:hypothetical protein
LHIVSNGAEDSLKKIHSSRWIQPAQHPPHSIYLRWKHTTFDASKARVVQLEAWLILWHSLSLWYLYEIFTLAGSHILARYMMIAGFKTIGGLDLVIYKWISRCPFTNSHSPEEISDG